LIVGQTNGSRRRMNSLVSAMKKFLAAFRRIRNMLQNDRGFRAFHEGRSAALPDYYRRVYERKLGEYAGLLSQAERTPVLEAS
jgi:hypothetical protein